MMRGNHAIGLPHFSKFEHKCGCCVTGKLVTAPFLKSTKFRNSKQLELVYAEICGPITLSVINRGKYFFANF